MKRDAPLPFDAGAFIRETEAALGFSQRSPLERVADLFDLDDGTRGAGVVGSKVRGSTSPFEPVAYTEDTVMRARMAAEVGKLKAEVGKAEAEADAVRAANERARAEVASARAGTERERTIEDTYDDRVIAVEGAARLVRRLRDLEASLTAEYGAEAAEEMIADIRATAGVDRLEIFGAPRPRRTA